MMPKKSPSAHANSINPTIQMPPKKSYSREFKLETRQLLKSSGKTKADMRKLGLYPGQIHLWEKAFNRKDHDVEQAFPGTWAHKPQGHRSDAEAEVSRLKRENEILRKERDILKKAMASRPRPLFSKTQDRNWPSGSNGTENGNKTMATRLNLHAARIDDRHCRWPAHRNWPNSCAWPSITPC